MNEKCSDIVCIVTGGIGDEVLALPALRYLQQTLRRARIQIRLGGWQQRYRLFRVLWQSTELIHSLEALYRKAEQGNQSIFYDWILNFDIRTLRGKVPERLQAKHAYFCLEKDGVHKNAIVLKPDDPFYWQHCFEIAYRFTCRFKDLAYTRAAMISCRESYRTVEPPRITTTLNKKIKALLSNVDPGQVRLAVTPGGYNPKHKLWPVQRFAEVICHAVDRGISVFVLGSKEESILARELLSHIRQRPERWLKDAPGNLTFLTGGLRLEELPFLLQKTDLHLSNDNGVAQIAGALNRPQIVLYRGKESPHRTPGFRDVALFSNKDSEMNGISTKAVIDALEKMVTEVT